MFHPQLLSQGKQANRLVEGVLNPGVQGESAALQYWRRKLNELASEFTEIPKVLRTWTLTELSSLAGRWSALASTWEEGKRGPPPQSYMAHTRYAMDATMEPTTSAPPTAATYSHPACGNPAPTATAAPYIRPGG